MKNLLIIAMALLLALPVVAQNRSEKPKKRTTELPLDSIFPFTNGKILYTEVFDVPDTTINDTYLKAKLWFADNFKDAKSVIQVDDKENGIIKGKGVWDYGGGHWMFFTITLKMKQGKAKYELTDIIHNWSGYVQYAGNVSKDEPLETWFKPTKKEAVISVGVGINDHFVSFCNSLKASLINKVDNDW